MIASWPQMRSWLLSWETMAVTDIPGDPGGQTAGGISRRYHPQARVWRLVEGGVTDGPEYEAAVNDFYDEQYQAAFEMLPRRLRAVYTDTAVNMGRTYATQCLQDALCRIAGTEYVDIDGVMGPQTETAVKHCDPSAVAFAMCAIRLAEYGRKARRGDDRRAFLDGWINRVRDLMGVI